MSKKYCFISVSKSVHVTCCGEGYIEMAFELPFPVGSFLLVELCLREGTEIFT